MDKKSYAFGMSLAGNLLQNGVHGLNFDDFVAGHLDGGGRRGTRAVL